MILIPPSFFFFFFFVHGTSVCPPFYPRSYERFSDTKDNQVDWTRLLISTRAPPHTEGRAPKIPECAICMGLLAPVPLDGDPSTTTRCGHTFHGMCLVLWKASKPRPTCPCCHGSIA